MFPTNANPSDTNVFFLVKAYGYIGGTTWVYVGDVQYGTYQAATGVIRGPIWLR